MDTCRRYGYKYPCAGDGGDSDKAGGANHEVCRLDPGGVPRGALQRCSRAADVLQGCHAAAAGVRQPGALGCDPAKPLLRLPGQLRTRQVSA